MRQATEPEKYFIYKTRQLMTDSNKAKLEGSMCFSQVSTLQLSFDELHVDGELVLENDTWEANSGDLLVVFRMKQ